MIYGNEAIMKKAMKDDKDIVIEIFLSEEIVNDAVKIIEENNEILSEAVTGTITYNNGVKIAFSDTQSMTRAQQQNNSNKRTSEHGNRVKIKEPKEYEDMEIFIPTETSKPVYLSNGKKPYTGKISNKMSEAVSYVQTNRKYFDIIFKHPNDTKEQARCIVQLISKDNNIKKINTSIDNDFKERFDRAFERRNKKNES